jgi:glyoxylase-like metal-dependent hydrolase (beta-lactamase superfamily II)
MIAPAPAVQQQPPRAQAVAERIIQVRLPLPFALNHVNCYLLNDGDGWTLLDTGLHWPDAEAVWQQTLQQLTGAPVLVGALEHAAIERIWIQDSWREAAAVEFWRRAGLDETMCALVSEQVASLRQRTMPHPTDFVLIDPAQELVMGGRCFQPLLAPGHSDGQLIFYSPVDQLMLCGDQLLGKISPNIGLWPGGAAQPLQHYLQSLAQLEQLAVTLALPGHGAPILTWQARIAALHAHHATRLAAMIAVIDADRSGRCTALTVAQQIFDFARFSEHEIRFAVAETLAHLAYLVAQGELRQEIEAGRQIYHRNEPYNPV